MGTFTLERFPFRIPSSEIEQAYVGTTWDGFTVSMSATGTTFDNSLSSVEMSWQLAGASTEALELTSGAGEITITDAANWAFRVEKVVNWTLPAGAYGFSIVCTDSAGDSKVYFTGTHCTIADPVQ